LDLDWLRQYEKTEVTIWDLSVLACQHEVRVELFGISQVGSRDWGQVYLSCSLAAEFLSQYDLGSVDLGLRCSNQNEVVLVLIEESCDVCTCLCLSAVYALGDRMI
jgi:hypothetical protein